MSKSTNTFKAPTFVDDSASSHGLQVEEIPKSKEEINWEELSKLAQQPQPFIFPQQSTFSNEKSESINLFPGPWTYQQGTQQQTSKKSVHIHGKSTEPTVSEPMEQPPSGTKGFKEDESLRKIDELKTQNAELLRLLQSLQTQNKSQPLVQTPSESNSQKQELSIHPQPFQFLQQQQQQSLPPPMQPVPLPQELAIAIGKCQQLALFQNNQAICSTPGCTHPAKKKGMCGTCNNNEDRKALKLVTQALKIQQYENQHAEKIAKQAIQTKQKKFIQQMKNRQSNQKIAQALQYTQELTQHTEQLELENQKQRDVLMSLLGYNNQ